MSATISDRTGPPPRLTRRRACLIASLAAFLLCFLGSWGHSLWDPDEPPFAESSRGMIAERDFLVPHVNGEPRYDKPILVYWFQVAGYSLLGVGEAGARLPSALGLALAAFFAARIGSRVFCPRAGLAAGLMLPVCVQGAILGRAGTADALLLGMVMLTLDGVHTRLRGHRTPSSWLRTWGGVGLCLLTKGPPGVVAPAAAGLGALVITWKEPAGRRIGSMLLGILFAVGLFALWAVPADLATSGEFHRTALGFHVADRAMYGNRGHGGWEPWWLLFYPPVILLFLFPWSPWIHRAFRQWRSLSDRRDRAFLGYWVLGTLLAFALSIGKMPHYVFPLYPGLLILLGGAFSRSAAERRSLLAGREGLLILGLLTLGFAAIAAGIVCWLLRLDLALVIPAAAPSLLLLAGGLAGLWILRSRPRPVLQGICVLAGMGGSTLLAVLLVLPAMEPHRLVSRAGAAIARAVPPSARLGQIGYDPRGLYFYVQRDENGRLGLGKARIMKRLQYPDTDRELTEFAGTLDSDEAWAIVIGEKQRRLLDASYGLDRLPGRIAWSVRGLNLWKGRWETISIHVSRGADRGRLEAPRPVR